MRPKPQNGAAPQRLHHACFGHLALLLCSAPSAEGMGALIRKYSVLIGVKAQKLMHLQKQWHSFSISGGICGEKATE